MNLQYSFFLDGRMRKAPCLAALLVLILTGLGDIPSAQSAADQVQPGELIVDHPTLINLGFEWVIQGDENRNAQVEVSYRKQGSTAWTPGLETVPDAGGVQRSHTPGSAQRFRRLRRVRERSETDGFAGQAPDLGALEAGQAPPHYGPRPL
jgi:hypothetical protein